MCLPNQSERVSNWLLYVALYNQNAILIHGIVAGLLWLDNLSIFVLCFPWTAVLIIIALRAELKAFLTDLLDLSVNSLANFLYEPQECSLFWAGTFSRQRKGLISSRSRFGGSGVGVSLDSELQCKDLKGWHKLGTNFTNFCKLERFGDNTCTRFRMAQHGSFAICHQGSAFSSLCSFSFILCFYGPYYSFLSFHSLYTFFLFSVFSLFLSCLPVLSVCSWGHVWARYNFIGFTFELVRAETSSLAINDYLWQ